MGMDICKCTSAAAAAAAATKQINEAEPEEDSHVAYISPTDEVLVGPGVCVCVCVCVCVRARVCTQWHRPR